MVLVALDEYQNQSISNMIDRIKSLKGDPRFYLAELKVRPSDKIRNSDEHMVFLHRLPYMKMKKITRRRVNLCLFTLLVLSVWDPLEISEYLYYYTSVIRSMLDLMIVPGVLLYYRYREKWLLDDVDVPLIIKQNRIYESQMKATQTASMSSRTIIYNGSRVNSEVYSVIQDQALKDTGTFIRSSSEKLIDDRASILSSHNKESMQETAPEEYQPI